MLNTFTRCNLRTPIRPGDFVTFRTDEEYTGGMYLPKYRDRVYYMTGPRTWNPGPEAWSKGPIRENMDFPITCIGVRSGAIDISVNSISKLWGLDTYKLSKRYGWMYRNMAQKIEYDTPPVCPIVVKHKQYALIGLDYKEEIRV